jgi:hypothetical protein
MTGYTTYVKEIEGTKQPDRWIGGTNKEKEARVPTEGSLSLLKVTTRGQHQATHQPLYRATDPLRSQQQLRVWFLSLALSVWFKE